MQIEYKIDPFGPNIHRKKVKSHLIYLKFDRLHSRILKCGSIVSIKNIFF